MDEEVTEKEKREIGYKCLECGEFITYSVNTYRHNHSWVEVQLTPIDRTDIKSMNAKGKLWVK